MFTEFPHELVADWRRLLPPLESLPAAPKRIVLHWTGGGMTANAVDKEHYHFVVDQFNRVVPGRHSVAANMKRLVNTAAYAGHTGGFNSFSLGVAMAGMMSATDEDNLGPYPLREAQVHHSLAFAALCTKTYKLDPKNAAHLFTHHEAWTVHGVKGQMNHLKLDIRFLPFGTAQGTAAIGAWLREIARVYHDLIQ